MGARASSGTGRCGMTTLSTHDTKRSEDVRARLLAVAGDAEAGSAAREAFAAAADAPRGVDRPTAHLLWQTLVGRGPIDAERLHGYLTKAVREAKQHTSWLDPDEDVRGARCWPWPTGRCATGGLRRPVAPAVDRQRRRRPGDRPRPEAAPARPARRPRHLPGLRARRPLAGRPRQPPPGRLRARGGPAGPARRRRRAPSTSTTRSCSPPRGRCGCAAATPEASARARRTTRCQHLRARARLRAVRPGRARRERARPAAAQVAVLVTRAPHRLAGRRRLGRRHRHAARGASGATSSPGGSCHGGAEPVADVLRRPARGPAGVPMTTRRSACVSSRSGRPWPPTGSSCCSAAERVAADPRRRRLVARRPHRPTPGAPYGFCLDGGDPRPDPRSRRQPDGPHGPLGRRSTRPRFAWTDARLVRRASWPTASSTSCTSARSPPEGTLDAAVERLDHLVDLGVTLVELMPLAAFPGGTAGATTASRPYAVHEPYGGPEALQRFVDACHAHGLGRLPRRRLQPPRAGRQLPRPSSGPTSPTRTRRRGARRSTSTARGSDEVRACVVDNALMWLRDFHLDGLRLDAVHELHDEPRAALAGGAVAAGGRARPRRSGRPLSLIAESDLNDPAHGDAPRPGGAGGTGPARAVGRRLPPRPARGADRRVPGLLRRLRHARRARQGARPRRSSTTAPTPRSAAAATAVRSTAAHAAGGGSWPTLQTHDQVGNRAHGRPALAPAADPACWPAGRRCC